MQAGFLRLFACRERDEKEELPLEFSLRILLNPRMLSCSLNLLRCQFNGAASVAALLRGVKNAGWVVGEQIFLHAHKGTRAAVSLATRASRIPCREGGPRAERRWTLALPLSLISYLLFGDVESAPTSFCCALCRLPTAILSCCYVLAFCPLSSPAEASLTLVQPR